MENTQISTGKNQAIAWAKLVAALFVVLIHVKFPEPFGSLATCLARFAVPLFFAVSGYFSYRISPGKILRRLKSTGKLYCIALLLAVLGSTAAACHYGVPLPEHLLRFVPDFGDLSGLLLVNQTPFPDTGYTWYLLGLTVCYLIFWVYTGFFEEDRISYRPLYTVSILLLCMHLLMGEMSPSQGSYVPYLLYRNGLFMGLPMFSLGLFIREYHSRILRCYRLNDGKLVGLLLLGLVLTLIQWKGSGTGELPPGTVIQTAALMLLLAKHPGFGPTRISVSALNTVSTVIYLIHLPLLGIYEAFLLPAMQFPREYWLRPVLIQLMSLLIGIVCAILKRKTAK